MSEKCPDPAPPPVFSFEFFPPKNPAQEARFWQCAQPLVALRPAFVSVTCGAGGAAQGRTRQVVHQLRQRLGLEAAAHLTCVGASRAEIDTEATRYWREGVPHIVALRGDPPGGGAWQPHPDGYGNAAALVAGLRRIGDFEISVAAYPETHPAAVSAAADIENLLRKIGAGASRAITQYFFDVEDFLRFRDACAAAGLTAPLVPGILPIANFAQIARFSAACGARVPAWLAARFAACAQDEQAERLTGALFAAEQIAALRREGVAEFHLYTLNQPGLAFAVALSACETTTTLSAREHTPAPAARPATARPAVRAEVSVPSILR